MNGSVLLAAVFLLVGCGEEESDPCAVAPDANGARPIALEGARVGSSYCAIYEGGGLRCWGDNYYGQIRPVEVFEDYDLEQPTIVPEVGCVARVSLSGVATCAQSGQETLRCWGDDWLGTIGNGSTQVANGTPVPVRGVGRVETVLVYDSGVSVERVLGGLMAWGYIANIDTDRPTYLTNVPWRIADHALFLRGGCFLDLDQRLWCWGANLADPKAPQQAVHAMLDSMGAAVVGEDVEIGGNHGCVRGADGSLRCWGQNSDAQLGIGTLQSADVPTLVVGLPPVVQVVAGVVHTCVRDEDGAVWCWGLQAWGEVGPNGAWRQTTPVQVPLPRPAVDIALSVFSSCALDVDGAIWCWGWNQHGELGNGGPATGGPEPTQVLW